MQFESRDNNAANTFRSSKSNKKAKEAKGKEGIVPRNIPFIKPPFRRNQYVLVGRRDTDSQLTTSTKANLLSLEKLNDFLLNRYISNWLFNIRKVSWWLFKHIEAFWNFCMSALDCLSNIRHQTLSSSHLTQAHYPEIEMGIFIVPLRCNH